MKAKIYHTLSDDCRSGKTLRAIAQSKQHKKETLLDKVLTFLHYFSLGSFIIFMGAQFMIMLRNNGCMFQGVMPEGCTDVTYVLTAVFAMVLFIATGVVREERSHSAK